MRPAGIEPTTPWFVEATMELFSLKTNALHLPPNVAGSLTKAKGTENQYPTATLQLRYECSCPLWLPDEGEAENWVIALQAL